MRVGFLLVILMIAVSACKKSEVEENIIVVQEGQFSVLTYNVAGLPEGISSSHPVLYTSSISKLISDYNIVHVQEDFCYHDSLLLFDEHPYRTETTGCVPGGDGLNTLSDFPIHGLQRFPWTDCTGADCFTPKGFSFSQIEIIEGVLLDVYNIHCTAGSSDESKAARRKNIEQICNYIQSNSEGKAALVMGDFNSRYTREGDTIRAFLDLGFQDVWIKLIRDDEIPDYGTSSLSSCDSPRTKPDCERVDKIFYRSNEKIELTPLDYQLDDAQFYYMGNDTLELSDHWPMFATFKFKVSD